MIGNRSLPLAAEACLSRAYPSSQKGGTLIAEEVQDLQTHERRLWDPDSYRPSACCRCGSAVHIHDHRPRVLLGESWQSTEVVRFRCADRQRCGAVWQILPGFVARHLWRSWKVVESALEESNAFAVPVRTVRRWKSRLATAARLLVVLLSTTVDEALSSLASAVGLEARRFDLVRGYRQKCRPTRGRCLAELAALVHRLSPGVRLM